MWAKKVTNKIANEVADAILYARKIGASEGSAAITAARRHQLNIQETYQVGVRCRWIVNFRSIEK